MSHIQNTASLVRLARREGMQAAADLLERDADRIQQKADKIHSKWMKDGDGLEEYEAVQDSASQVQACADRIRRAAKRMRSA